jgi:hypothetical protein
VIPVIEIDDERRRVVLTSGSDVMSRALIGALIDVVVQAPQRADHDFIIDLRESYGDGSHDDVVRAAQVFRACGAGRRATRTCFVSYDAGFVHWARTMDFCFPNRTHHVFMNVQAAHAFLDRGKNSDRVAAAA